MRVSIGLRLAQLISLVRAHAGVEVRLSVGLGGVALDRAGLREGWGRTRLKDGRSVGRDWVKIGPMDKLWGWLLDRPGIEPRRVMNRSVDES